MNGFCPLASGSKGNVLYLGTKKTKILIDAGISLRALKERLEAIQVDIEEIDAVLLTHEHSDHILGLKSIATKLNIPILANHATAKAVAESLGICPKFKIFSTGESFKYGDLRIDPFSIPHDSADPVGFAIETEGAKLGICADLGFATSLVQAKLQHCTYLYVEANHHPPMVHASSRPDVYKKRVLSRSGHLSNEECGALVAKTFHPGLKHIHLAHLSSECNTEATALSIVSEALSKHGFAVPTNIAKQDRPSHGIFF